MLQTRMMGSSERTGGRTSLLVTVLVMLPLGKTAMLIGAPFVQDFERSDDRRGFYLFWIVYLVAEVSLAGVAVAVCGVGSLRASLQLTSVVGRVGSALLVAVVVLASARAAGSFDVPDSGAEFNIQGGATVMQRLFLLAGAVIAVACEELLFRWFAVGALRSAHAGRGLSIALPAISFGIFHLDFSFVGMISAVWTAAGGAMLGELYLRKRSLAWPMVLHAAVILPIVALAPVRVA